MPFEWYAILYTEKPLCTFSQLKYELTVSDVYDILELMEMDRFYNIEREKISDANS